MAQQSTSSQPFSAADPSSFYGALQKKYSNSTVKVASGFQVYLPQVKHGLTETGGWNIPKYLNLDCGTISIAGDVSSLADYCGNVVELNLAQNALVSWREIFAILDCMPGVEFLNLSQNPLSPDVSSSHTTAMGTQTEPAAAPQETRRYAKVKNLVLTAARLPLSTINYLIEETFPSLQELYLSKNDYASLDELASGGAYPSLSLLQLSSNGLRRWSAVAALGRRFTSLETLVLNDNPLTIDTALTVDTAPATPTPLAASGDELLGRLSSLNLSGSAIATWSEVQAISDLPSLVDVRLMGIPLVEGMDDKRRRQLLVASFTGRLARLNGSAITAEERDNAERAYLRHFADASERPQRYKVLEVQHGGVPLPLANVSLRPPVTVTVTAVCRDKREQMTIPLRHTVADVKKMLQTFAGLSSAKFDLYRYDPEMPFEPEKLLWLQKQLYTLNLRDGQELHVEPKRC